jgi:hypothetical protein
MTTDSFCVMPWRNLNTTPMGQCKLCCNITDFKVIHEVGGTPLNWGTNSLTHIWNGEHMQGVRQKMLQGEQVSDCGICYGIEASGVASPRQLANQAQPMDRSLLGRISDSLPVSFELRPSTRCNLTCVTCWSGSSDRVAAQRRELLDDDNTVLPPWLAKEWHKELRINKSDGSEEWKSDGDYISRSQSLDNFKLMAPTLQRLYITGGEPTMDANIYQYLDILLEAGNTDCEVSFTTNCTLWNPKLIQQLSQFKTEVQISIDGFGAQDEFIRQGTVWSEKDQNFRRYLSSGMAQSIKIFTVVSALNCLSMRPLLRHISYTVQEIGTPCIWFPIVLDFPPYLSVEAVPLAARQSAWRDLKRSIPQGPCDMHHGIAYAQQVVTNRPFDSDLSLRLQQWLVFKRTAHGIDTADILPELTEALVACA